MKKVMVSSLSAFAFCLSSALTVSAAPVIMEAEIENGSGGGFGYSTVHSATKNCSDGFCKSGATVLGNLSGKLTFTFDDVGGFSMTDVSGSLLGDEGTIEITGGSLSDPDATTGFASGSLDYLLAANTGPSTTVLDVGTFHFEALSFSSLGQNGPNNINGDNFWLWGNNWDVVNGAQQGPILGGMPLGLDLKGGSYTVSPASVPAPSAMLLMGSGLLGLAAWRMKKSHQA